MSIETVHHHELLGMQMNIKIYSRMQSLLDIIIADNICEDLP